jgi:Nucleotidyltransferase of unknown function (DUF6036)
MSVRATGSADPDPELHTAPLRADALLSELAAHGVDFIVIGGFALAAHGVVRGTKDLDVTPNPDPENLARLAAALEAIDARLLVAEDFDPGELGITFDAEGLAGGGNWILDTRLGRLDVMQDLAGIRDGYRRLRQRAVTYELPGIGAFLFAGLDDLIAMKAAAGRDQDKIDIASLERARAQGRGSP